MSDSPKPGALHPLNSSREALKAASVLLKGLPRQRNQDPKKGGGETITTVVVLKAVQADLLAAVLDRAVEVMGEYTS